MRIPRLRFSVWLLMVVVAFVASGIFTAQMIQRHRAFAELAEQNALSEKENRDEAADMRRQLANQIVETPFGLFGSLSWYKSQVKVLDARAARNAALKQKYRNAARHPWLSVESDPPEPPDAELSYDPVEPRQDERPVARSSYGLIVMPPKIELGVP
jgi:hypothetical protein